MSLHQYIPYRFVDVAACKNDEYRQVPDHTGDPDSGYYDRPHKQDLENGTEGGVACNVIPEHCVCRFYVRAAKKSYLKHLYEQVMNCGKAAAMATGYFDDRAERPWGRTKKGLLDLAVSVAAALCLSGFSDVQVWLPLDTVLRAAPPDPAAGYQPLLVPWWGHLLYAVPILWITMNATNCTDGVDGLAGSLSLVALFSLAAFLYGVIGHEEAARYLLVPHDPAGARWAILCCVVGGGVARALGLLIGVAVLATGNPFVGLAIAPVILANGATGLLKILLLKGLARLGVDTGSPDDATRGHWLARKLRSVRFPLHDHCRAKLGWSGEQVLVRFVLVQAALMPALFLLLVKIR